MARDTEIRHSLNISGPSLDAREVYAEDTRLRLEENFERQPTERDRPVEQIGEIVSGGYHAIYA